MFSTCASTSADQGRACSRWLSRNCSSQWRSSSYSARARCPLLGVKRTWQLSVRTSALDPEPTSRGVTSWVLELEDVFRLHTATRPCRPLQRTALLARQPCARQFFGNCPIRVDSRFYRAHPYTDKSRRCDSHSTLEGRTELGRPFERRRPGLASNTW
jgi:hypothetical protein